jgi:nitrogen-specific signal transduction histidine kinase
LDIAWSTVRDAVLRGLTHALSNRVMAITTLADLAGDASAVTTTRTVLASEAVRLDALLQQFRLLSPAAPAPAEPLNIADVLAPLVDLAGRHPDVVGTPCDVRLTAGVQPAFVDAGQVGRIVPALVVAAMRAARRLQPPRVQVDVRGDARWVVVGAAAGDAVGAGSLPDETNAGVPAIGIFETPRGARYELRMPTLAAARRRDRASG